MYVLSLHDEMYCMFVADEKINSMRRLTVLTEDLIKEIVPEVGLRADLEDCLQKFKKSIFSEKVYYKMHTDIWLRSKPNNAYLSKRS